MYKFKVTVSDGESSLYSTDYSQPLPWRKNWVITKSFSEIEAERAKPDIQLKPSLPYRPSLKQHPVVSRQSTASTRLDEDNDGVYDNIVATRFSPQWRRQILNGPIDILTVVSSGTLKTSVIT